MQATPLPALELGLSRPTSVTWGGRARLVVALITAPQLRPAQHGGTTKAGDAYGMPHRQDDPEELCGDSGPLRHLSATSGMSVAGRSRRA